MAVFAGPSGEGACMARRGPAGMATEKAAPVEAIPVPALENGPSGRGIGGLGGLAKIRASRGKLPMLGAAGFWSGRRELRGIGHTVRAIG